MVVRGTRQHWLQPCSRVLRRTLVIGPEDTMISTAEMTRRICVTHAVYATYGYVSRVQAFIVVTRVSNGQTVTVDPMIHGVNRANCVTIGMGILW